MHMVRAYQERAFLRKIAASRHDHGFLPSVRQGLDMFAATWKARTKGKAKCTAWQLGVPYNYLAGGDHTQQRKARADVSADPSPPCRRCDGEEETQERVVWRCPCWAHERKPLTDLIAADDWRRLPPHTPHCGTARLRDGPSN